LAEESQSKLLIMFTEKLSYDASLVLAQAAHHVLTLAILPIQISNAGPQHNNGTDAKGVLIQASALQHGLCALCKSL
jgi:hypothetical protein